MAELTIKQRQFADEYVKTGNASESYMKVYNCKLLAAEANSSRLIRNDKVIQYMSELNKNVEKSTIADITEIKDKAVSRG